MAAGAVVVATFGGPAGRAASFEATVTRRVINKKLPDATFAADYPPGTQVYDASVDLPIYDSDDQSGNASSRRGAGHPQCDRRRLATKTSQGETLQVHLAHRKAMNNTINTFCVDGEKVHDGIQNAWPRSDRRRYRPTKVDVPDSKEKDGRSINRKRVFDGVATRTLSFSNDPQRPGGVLDIRPATTTLTSRLAGRPLSDARVPPVRRELRRHATSPTCGIPPSSESASSRGEIGNVACVVIETEPGPGMQLSYWLDPARDYIPLRAAPHDQRRRSRTTGFFLQGRSRVRVGSGRLDGNDRRHGRQGVLSGHGHNHRVHDQPADPGVGLSDRSSPQRESPGLADRPPLGTPESCGCRSRGETEGDRSLREKRGKKHTRNRSPNRFMIPLPMRRPTSKRRSSWRGKRTSGC